MTVETRTVGRLEGLLRLYHTGYHSSVVDKTVEKLVTLEVTRSDNELTRLRERLEAYERQYNMTSEDFYTKFRSGELGTRWILWNGASFGICIKAHRSAEWARVSSFWQLKYPRKMTDIIPMLNILGVTIHEVDFEQTRRRCRGG